MLHQYTTGLLVMPMCHANSLYFDLTFMYLGATIVVDDRKSFDPEGLLETLARDKVTFTSLVPTHYIMLLPLPDAVKARHDVSAVGKLPISSALARKDTKLAILSHFANSRLFDLQGATETGWVTLLRPERQIDEAFRGEWCSVGDMARRDVEGYSPLVDRKSDMNIGGGGNIYPSEVEGVIGAFPAVTAIGKIVHRSLRECIVTAATS